MWHMHTEKRKKVFYCCLEQIFDGGGRSFLSFVVEEMKEFFGIQLLASLTCTIGFPLIFLTNGAMMVNGNGGDDKHAYIGAIAGSRGHFAHHHPVQLWNYKSSLQLTAYKMEDPASSSHTRQRTVKTNCKFAMRFSGAT